MVCGLCSVLSLVIGMCVCDSLLFLFRVCSLNVVMVVGLHGMIRHAEIAIVIKFLAPIMMLTILVVMMKMLMTMVMTILLKKEK